MSQQSFVIPNQSRTNFRLQVQAAVQALVSQNAGPAGSLSETYPNELIADTTSGHILKRNNANDAWDYLMPIDQSIIASAAGTDTYAIALAPAISAYKNGVIYRFKADVANTGAATININAVGAKAIKRYGNGVLVALKNGDISANGLVLLVYDSTADVMILLNPAQQITPGQVADNLPPGLTVANNDAAPNTKLDATAKSAWLADVSGNAFYVDAPSYTLDATQVGVVNGSRAALAVSTQYYLFLISNGTTSGLWLDTSATSPTLPSGYTYYRLIAAPLTDGSAHLLGIYQTDRFVALSGATKVLDAGTDTTYTAVDLSAFIPPQAVGVEIIAKHAFVSNNRTTSISWDGTNAWTQIGTVTSGNSYEQYFGRVPIKTAQTIYYIQDGTGATCTIWVQGYHLNL